MRGLHGGQNYIARSDYHLVAKRNLLLVTKGAREKIGIKLDVKPSSDAFETRANVMKAIQGHILAKAVHGGLFRRPQ